MDAIRGSRSMHQCTGGSDSACQCRQERANRWQILTTRRVVGATREPVPAESRAPKQAIRLAPDDLLLVGTQYETAYVAPGLGDLAVRLGRFIAIVAQF